jgi:hypothetical protein
MKQYFIILLMGSLAACGAKKDKKGLPASQASSTETKDTVVGPYSYNLNEPEKFYMADELVEISGITFSPANNDTIYAQQDEAGRLYHFKLGDKRPVSAKFAKKGDYEDLAICNGNVIMLRSDGVLFSFLLSEANNERIEAVQEWPSLLPEGEYEGLYADAVSSRLYVLCKHCSADKTSKIASGTILQLATDGKITVAGNFTVNVKEIETMANENKISFRPAALAKSPATGDWYILSSVNKMLVIADANWKVKAVYPLNNSVFNQPEGIAFDSNNNLYISNEGGESGTGTILKFIYHNR